MTKVVMLSMICLASLICAVTQGYCDELISDPELRVFEGRVVSVDRSSVKVKGIAEIDFPVSLDTKLTRGNYQDIKILDIKVDDYVTVEYYRKGDDSRLPSKVVSIDIVQQ